jgi:hypothetical protein
MPTEDYVDASQFIEDLELASPPEAIVRLPLQSPVLQADKEAGFVDAGSLMSFVAGLTGEHQKDVLDSTLLAQLAANKKFDREKNVEDWYKYYRTVLETVGWVVEEFKFTRYETVGSTFTVEQVVLEILAALVAGSELTLVTATLNALKKAKDGSKPFTIWDASTHSAENGNFQICAASDIGGVPTMALGAFHFSTKESTTRFLWFSYSNSKIAMYKAGQKISLNEITYSKVRQQVIDKLGNNAVRFVANLEI